MNAFYFILLTFMCGWMADNLARIYKAIQEGNEIAERQITATYELVRAVNQAADNSKP